MTRRNPLVRSVLLIMWVLTPIISEPLNGCEQTTKLSCKPLQNRRQDPPLCCSRWGLSFFFFFFYVPEAKPLCCNVVSKWAQTPSLSVKPTNPWTLTYFFPPSHYLFWPLFSHDCSGLINHVTGSRLHLHWVNTRTHTHSFKVSRLRGYKLFF